MKSIRCRMFFFHIMILTGLITARAGFAETPRKSDQAGAPGSIVVKSDSLEIDNLRKVVTFTGNVDAKKDNFRINCRKMHLYYLEGAGKRDQNKKGVKIDKIIAEGEVKITRAEGGVAMAEKAVYHQNDDKVVLTGKPVVKQGDDFVEGSRVILFLKEKRSIVEGSKDQKVRAVLFPKDEKR